MLEITRVDSENEIEHVRSLFREYAASLDFDLCFQDFEEELSDLPGSYTPPRGAILLAKWHGEASGCVAMRPIENDICEMKRLYVRPDYRGKGIGRALAAAIVLEAKKSKYRKMRLDTVPSMKTARSLYESLGFREIPPYYKNPIPGATYMELALDNFSLK